MPDISREASLDLDSFVAFLFLPIHYNFYNVNNVMEQDGVLPRYILVVDQGTTGTRAVLYDNEGRIINYSYREHRQIYPRPGWVEHDPLEIWRNTVYVMKDAVKLSEIDPSDIVSVGITNQRETTIVWDKATGKPIYNAIVWQDTRTINYCKSLIEKGLSKFVHEKTGLTISTYFSASKIKWILDNIPGARDRAEHGEILFGTIDTWIIWNMTRGTRDHLTPDRGGAHVIDYSNASRTMLFDIVNHRWSIELLEKMRIPYEILPVVVPSSSRKPYGYMNKDILGEEIPIHGDLGDQQAALVGQTCFRRGEMKSTYGTGTFMLLNTGDKPVHSSKGLLTTIGYVFEGYDPVYALEGSVAISGAAIQWLRDNLRIIRDPSETEKLAGKTGEIGSGGVYFVPAFSGLYAPYWDMTARGLIIGLTRYTRIEHIVHAVLEAIAYQVRDVYEAMIKDAGIVINMLKVDGGATKNNYLMQLQANILGIPVLRPRNIETTSLGAAFAAGLGAGLWRNIDELRKLWVLDKEFKPIWSKEKREKLYSGWRSAVKRAMKWLDEVGELPGSGAYWE